MYSSDGHFITSFGTEGKRRGEFNYPTDIAIDKDGKIYVTEYGNHRVQVS